MWFLPCVLCICQTTLSTSCSWWEAAWSWPQLLWDMGQETLAGLGASWLRSTPLRAPGPAAAGSEAHSPSSLLSQASALPSPLSSGAS